jgi:DUF4097 and DUF4098 domain-containing protein YvlB
MMTTLLAAVLALGMAQQPTDTTVAMRAGGRVHLEAVGGSASFGTWDREAVRVRALHPSGMRVDVRPADGGVRVEAAGHAGAPAAAVRYEITVPRRASISVSGVNLSVDVGGTTGSVAISNVEGVIHVRDVTGRVSVESVAGGLVVDNVTGDVAAATVNQSIRLGRVRGSISAETVNGSITVTGADATEVRVSTVNGMIEYDGVIRDNGRYFLGAHNGQVTMTIPENANARIRLSSRTGRVEAAFPVSLSPARNNRFELSVGSGSADIELHSFNGAIRLARPGGR